MEGNQMAGLMALGGVVIALIAIVALAIGVALCWFLMTCFQRIPEAHRKQQPAMVWLLLIPCFNLVWNFFVHPRLADSYKSYFDSVGKQDVGDCGANLAKIYCWGCVVSIVPNLLSRIPGLQMVVGALSCLISLGLLVVLVLMLVKFGTLKGQIPEQSV